MKIDSMLQAYIGGHRFRSAKRLTNIKSYNRYEGGEALLRDYRLGYIENTNTVAGVPQLSRLNSVSECTSDGSCLPATRFNWQHRVVMALVSIMTGKMSLI